MIEIVGFIKILCFSYIQFLQESGDELSAAFYILKKVKKLIAQTHLPYFVKNTAYLKHSYILLRILEI